MTFFKRKRGAYIGGHSVVGPGRVLGPGPGRKQSKASRKERELKRKRDRERVRQAVGKALRSGENLDGLPHGSNGKLDKLGAHALGLIPGSYGFRYSVDERDGAAPDPKLQVASPMRAKA